MSGTSSVPSIKFTQTGLVIPDEAAILSGVQADNNAAFGGDMNPALNTPQGQLASSTAAIIGDKNNEIALAVNNVDPDTSAGRWQDAIGRIYFIERNPAEGTVVQADCTGLAGVVIPVGALASASDGNIYSCLEAGTIPVGGVIMLPFVCTVTGPIACPANSLSQVYKSIPGWDTINNASDGVIGNVVESRAAFETRRRASVALNAKGSLPAIKASVLNVPGVLDVYATTNVTSADIVVGGVTLVPHSIYVAVVGGLAEEIANAIWIKKSDGSDYNGNTSVTVFDKEGYSPPYPQYDVKYEIPAALPILFAVEIVDNPSLPSNIIALIQAAIISAFSGTDGGTRARIGATIYASRYYAPIAQTDPNVEILSVLIGTSTATLNVLNVNIDRVPTITAANIVVTLV